MPGVTVQFNFDLKDGIFLKADQKADLFKLILQYYGIGAKTNVGYGQFEPTS
jgi:CRISPR-associated protein Cmr6